jgi:simple sugar transport system permease protein
VRVTAEPTAKADAGGGPPDSDERVRRQNWLQQALTRPSSGAMLAALVAFLVFSWPLWECVADASACYGRGFLSPRGIANWLDVAAQVGILGAAVTLLMIAGEFDLSVGSMIGAAGMVIAIGMDVYGLSPFLAVAAAFAFALAVGFFNGWLVTKTGLPSFIVTLGMLFLLRGVTIGLTRLITNRTQVGGLSEYTADDPFSLLFTGEVTIPVLEIEIEASVIWWIALTGVAAWILFRTTFGNWILGTGGNMTAARNVGVPVRRVKISLFMGTAGAAALLATIQVLEFSSADTARGTLKELEAIAAAVIGGNLLTGGYGSPIGTFFGALTLGMTQVGIPMAGLPGDWFRAVLGIVLLVAVLGSNWIRMRGTGVRT